MLKSFIQYRSRIMGMMFGAMAGYAYFHFIGCNGSCMIGANPWISTIYGGILGGLFVNAFIRPERKEAQSQPRL